MVSTGTESQWKNIRQCKKNRLLHEPVGLCCNEQNRTSGGCISVPNTIIKHTLKPLAPECLQILKKQFNSLKTFPK